MDNSFWAAPGAYLQESIRSTMKRICDPTAAGLVASIAEDSGFQYGAGLKYIIGGLVPRVIWREKPTIGSGQTFSAYLRMGSDPTTVWTCTGETAAGELFWNFGWVGVLLGMYILGATFAGMWWRAAGPDPRRGLLEMIVYTGAVLSFMIGTGADAGAFFTFSISTGLLFRLLIAVRRSLRPQPIVSRQFRQLRFS
jgi:hypothetical protein